MQQYSSTNNTMDAARIDYDEHQEQKRDQVLQPRNISKAINPVALASRDGSRKGGKGLIAAQVK